MMRTQPKQTKILRSLKKNKLNCSAIALFVNCHTLDVDNPLHPAYTLGLDYKIVTYKNVCVSAKLNVSYKQIIASVEKRNLMFKDFDY